MRLFSVLAGFLSTVLALPIAAQETPEGPSTPLSAAQSPAGAPAAPAELPDRTPALSRPDLEAWLDGFMPYALERGDIAGSVVVVVKDGKILFEKGYGYSDVAKRKPVDPGSTLFRPGSVSKLFTWTAVMQQVEQGKIDLDGDVNKYLDFEIPPLDGKPVTMRNIMTHTSGLEEVLRGLILSDPKEIASLGATVKSQIPSRIFAPGTMPSYSNYATALAGYIVERVSGQSFDDYLDQHIFAPLDMKHSSFRQPLPATLLPLVSKGYKLGSDDKPKPYEFINMAPAGSLASTGTDMGRFMIAHLQLGAYGTGRILRAETASRMHTSAQTSIGPLAVHPAQAELIAAATSAGLFLSRDAGDEFKQVMAGAHATAAHFALEGDSLWFSAFDGKPSLYRVAIGGDAREETALPALERDAVANIAQNPARRAEFAIVTFERAVFLTPDAGTTWTRIAPPRGSAPER